MSAQPTLKQLSLLTLVGFFVGYGMTQSFFLANPAPTSGQMDFASKAPMFRGKSLAAIQIDLRAPAGIPEFETDEITLVGSVRLNQSFAGELHLNWELPDDVQIITGEEKTIYEELEKGEVIQTQITLRGFSREHLKLIGLHAAIHNEETSYGNTALMTSRPEDSYELVTGETATAANFQKVQAQDVPPARRPLEGKIIR